MYMYMYIVNCANQVRSLLMTHHYPRYMYLHIHIYMYYIYMCIDVTQVHMYMYMYIVCMLVELSPNAPPLPPVTSWNEVTCTCTLSTCTGVYACTSAVQVEYLYALVFQTLDLISSKRSDCVCMRLTFWDIICPLSYVVVYMFLNER